MKEKKIEEILKENITGQKPIEDCVFYTIGEDLTDEDINGIDTIEEFENKLDEKGINCIKIYTEEERIVYRQAISKEEESEISEEKGEQEIKKDSNDFETVYLKLFEYSKRFVMPDSGDTNSSGLPTILIKEYAKRQNGGKPVNYIEAEIDEAPDGGVRPPIYVRKIECNTTSETEGKTESKTEDKTKDKIEGEIENKTKSGNGTITQGSSAITQGNAGTTQSIIKQAEVVGKLSNVFNPNNEPLKTYILGTPTHVSSFMVQDNGIFYLFDTTGCTHQIQKVLKTPKPQVQLQQGQIQQQRDKVIYYTSKLILDKEEIPLSPNNVQDGQPEGGGSTSLSLLNNGQDGQPEGTLSPNNEQQQGSGDTIQPVSLNPFGLDYQNGSSACGIWTSNVLAVASTYKSIKDFIIKDKEEGYVAMFKSEFTLKVSAKVAKELSVNPEVKILEQEENLPGYCKCKVGNTLFAIDTTYNAGSCLNMKNVLLSVSQKELEFYNDDNNINDEIIKERKQLIERIDIEKTKYETAVCTTEASNVAKLKMQEVAVNQDILKLEITELKKAIEQDINKLEKVKSNITKLKEAKVKEAELKMAELEEIESEMVELDEIESERAKLEKSGSEEVGSEETELEGIELEEAELKEIKSEIAKMKEAKSEKAELKEAELDKINSDIEKLEKVELNATELKKVIEQDLAELNNIEQNVTESETDKLEEINKNIIELKEVVAKKQSDCYSTFIEYFAEILNIKNDSNDNAKDNIVDIAKDDSTKNNIAEGDIAEDNIAKNDDTKNNIAEDNNVKNDNIENNNAKNDNDVSETIKEIKFCCSEPIKTTNNQIAHAEKVDKLFFERQNEQINQSQQNNTKQQSDHSTRSF